MNIEEAIDILTQKEIIDLSNHFNNTRFFEAIYTLLTAYENLKSYNRGTKEALRVAEDLERQANKEAGDWEARCFELEAELEKEKEKNNRYFKQNIEYQKTLEKLQKETIWKDKIKEIIYPTPENYIPLEVQQSEMYKKLLKEVEE